MVTVVESNAAGVLPEGCGLDFSCSASRESLLAALSSVQSIVNRRGQTVTAQAVTNVLLSVKGGYITVVGANIDMSAISMAACDDGSGVVTVMGFMLFDIVRKLPNGCTVVMQKRSNGDVLRITCGKSEFELPTMDPERFPPIDYDCSSDDGVTLSCEDCFKLFDRVGFAISVDEARQFLCGAHVSIGDDGMLRAAATNGHRLAFMKVAVEFNGTHRFKAFILPRRAVFEVMRHAYLSPKEKLNISIQNNRAVFKFPSTVLVSKLIDGNYPDVDKIIPGRASPTMAVSASLFLEALERVTAVLLNKSNAVSIELNSNSMRVSAHALEYGSTAYESVAVEYDGPPVIISLNSKYIIELVSKCAGELFTCHVGSPDDPVLCLDDKVPDFLCVVMPMRA